MTMDVRINARGGQPKRAGAKLKENDLGMNRWRRKYSVLVADDLAEHCIMLACAMRRTESLQVLRAVHSRREAVRYLLGRGDYADRLRFPFPDIVVSEVGMSCLETVKLLAAMGSEDFSPPLQIVLTDSPLREHRRQAARLGADAYFIKPCRFSELINIVNEIERMLVGAEPRITLKEHAVRRA